LNALIRATALILFAAGAMPITAAEPPREIADLFPAGTLAYAELHDTAELAPQLAAVFKGTVLEDSIPFVHGRKDSAKTVMELAGKRNVAVLGLLASPEMLSEFKKLKIAAGVTGFTDRGDPDAAVVVLTHDSPAVGLAARAYLTMTAQVRKVGEVSGVPVFQYRTPNISYDENGNPLVQSDKPFSDGPHELTFAYTPGLFVIGTGKAPVGQAVRRFLGEDKGPGLGGTDLFREAAKAHRRAGLFFYVNYADFSARFGTAERVRGVPRGQGGDLRSFLAGGDSDLYDWFNLTANPKAVKSMAGCVRFRDGGLVATVAASFDPDQKSPLLDFLSGPGVRVEQLHHARRPSSYALAVALPEKNRAGVVVAFLDAAVKSKGELGRLPRDVVRELEEKHKVRVADDLLGKVERATVFMPAKQELPKGARPGPVLVLHTADAASAGAWEGFFPTLLGDLAGAANPPRPSAETIDGVRVMTVASAGLRWNAPVHFARSGSVVAVGLDRKLVAASVRPDAAGSVAGGERAIVPPAAESALVGTVSLGEVLPALFEAPRPGGPVVPVDEPRVLPNGQPVPERMIEELRKARKELTAALAALEPAAVSVRRSGNELRLELFQPKVQQGGLRAVIDAASNWLDRSASTTGNRRLGELELLRDR
jgi:hypothetical protein